MTTFNTCRFCDDWRNQNMVRYGTRHYAHFECYLDAGKKLSDLNPFSVGEFPYFLLKARGLLEEANRIADEQEKRSNRLAQIAWQKAVQS